MRIDIELCRFFFIYYEKGGNLGLIFCYILKLLGIKVFIFMNKSLMGKNEVFEI